MHSSTQELLTVNFRYHDATNPPGSATTTQNSQYSILFSPLSVIVTIFHSFFLFPLHDFDRGIILLARNNGGKTAFSLQCSSPVWKLRKPCFRTPPLEECVQQKGTGVAEQKCSVDTGSYSRDTYTKHTPLARQSSENR